MKDYNEQSAERRSSSQHKDINRYKNNLLQIDKPEIKTGRAKNSEAMNLPPRHNKINSMHETDILKNLNKSSVTKDEKPINLNNFNSTTKKVLINLPFPS